MYMTSKNTSKSGPAVDARFHDGMWLELRMKGDESIIGTSSGVIKGKDCKEVPRGSKMVR